MGGGGGSSFFVFSTVGVLRRPVGGRPKAAINTTVGGHDERNVTRCPSVTADDLPGHRRASLESETGGVFLAPPSAISPARDRSGAINELDAGDIRADAVGLNRFRRGRNVSLISHSLLLTEFDLQCRTTKAVRRLLNVFQFPHPSLPPQKKKLKKNYSLIYSYRPSSMALNSYLYQTQFFKNSLFKKELLFQ